MCKPAHPAHATRASMASASVRRLMAHYMGAPPLRGERDGESTAEKLNGVVQSIPKSRPGGDHSCISALMAVAPARHGSGGKHDAERVRRLRVSAETIFAELLIRGLAAGRFPMRNSMRSIGQPAACAGLRSLRITGYQRANWQLDLVSRRDVGRAPRRSSRRSSAPDCRGSSPVGSARRSCRWLADFSVAGTE